MRINDERPEDELTIAGARAAFGAALERSFARGPAPGLTGPAAIASMVDAAAFEVVMSEVVAARFTPENARILDAGPSKGPCHAGGVRYVIEAGRSWYGRLEPHDLVAIGRPDGGNVIAELIGLCHIGAGMVQLTAIAWPER